MDDDDRTGPAPVRAYLLGVTASAARLQPLADRFPESLGRRGFVSCGLREPFRDPAG